MLKLESKRGFLPVFSDFAENFFGRNDDFFPTLGLFAKNTPAVNIYETPEAFNLELGAPGMERQDFKVTVDNGVLTIKAEKKEKREEEGLKFTRREFNYMRFERNFMLPENILVDKINAVYEDGLLKVALPKTKVTKHEVKNIEISG
jgi:HSP20 family protein